MNLETITDTQSWYKIWPPNGSSRIRAKQKLLRKHKGACKSSWSRIRSLKSFSLTIPWNSAKPVNYARSEINGIAERAVRRIREGTSAVLLQSGLDEKWWADSMECYCSLRNVQDLLSDGNTPSIRKALWRTNHLKDQSFRLVHWLSITLPLRKTSQESINLEYSRTSWTNEVETRLSRGSVKIS